jgi:hypothetical protein
MGCGFDSETVTCCHLASCLVPEQMLILCNVAIWGHTEKGLPQLHVQTGHNTRTCTKKRLKVTEVSPAAPDPEGAGMDAIPDRVSHHSRRGSHRAKGRPPQDHSDRPTVRKGLAICRRVTIDRHHSHHLHWTRTGRTFFLLAGELSTVALKVYASLAARTIVFNCLRSATGKRKVGREQVA